MAGQNIFFRPPEGWVGDVIPYFHEGAFWLFYLHDRRDQEHPGTSWHLVRTTDFVGYDYLGEVLPHGDAESQDLHAYTGSVLAAEGAFHLFYTGYNPAVVDEETGRPLQAVMHAVSDDLLNWKKVPEHTFHAPRDHYEREDWRDPFVYQEEDGRYSMLLAARTVEGPSRRRGVTARCVSDDLANWTIIEPLWAPSRYITHECPDLFRIGEWWYLVYSEFSERYTTRYRMSRDPGGPWLVPEYDTLDGRALYAAKTASDGTRRYAFGWIPTRDGESDAGAWEWGGDLAVHELVQRPDGTLDVRMPETIRSTFSTPVQTHFAPVTGTWEPVGGLRTSATGSYASVVAPGLPSRYLASVTITFEPGTRECGLILRASADAEDGYIIRLEPQRDRLVFDRWPRRDPGPLQWQIDGDVPHAVELERPCDLAPEIPHRLDVIVDGPACIAYLDGRVAMSARMYDRTTGGIGLFVGEGAAVFADFLVTTSPTERNAP
ncbi:beta-fructofuranosidase [Acrocarpospora pleiomorpha]|uniref:beta-fructofuranosidase n=1 Tax=Acrocarpospora pleiomorpha TaxID=90975 RepID=A0A5M3XIZ3_9ACTN|nr:glycoside hydrolase family 32 protein [Acrocarpospora pleiomorpha]GES20732.1 beta-fructofuranosidase [Acrocarpospora pleiomorpha]